MADYNAAPVSPDSILFTEELDRRPLRPPDYEKESRALGALMEALANSPQTVLQALADTILDVLQCGSAGVSLLTTHDGGKAFYWPAISGALETTHWRWYPTRFRPMRNGSRSKQTAPVQACGKGLHIFRAGEAGGRRGASRSILFEKKSGRHGLGRRARR